jgi:transposase InsO family protein
MEIGGISRNANGLWMAQIARNLTDDVDGFFKGKRYLIHDRDPLFTQQFLSMLADMGIESVKLPPRSPNLNAYAERFVRTIKESCLEQMILFGEDSLRTSIRQFLDLSSAINRSELVSEYRRIMPESSQAGIRDVDHPELKPTQCSSLLECDVVRFEARPSANSDLVCPVRGWNVVVHDCNGWSRI